MTSLHVTPKHKTSFIVQMPKSPKGAHRTLFDGYTLQLEEHLYQDAVAAIENADVQLSPRTMALFPSQDEMEVCAMD